VSLIFFPTGQTATQMPQRLIFSFFFLEIRSGLSHRIESYYKICRGQHEKNY